MKSEVLSTVNQEFTWLSNNIDKIKVMIIQFQTLKEETFQHKNLN